jgi:tetratricopeptide (TPR) repeat protein
LQLANQDRSDWQTIELAYEQIDWAWQQLPEDETVLEFVWALCIYQTLRGLGVEQIIWIKRALQVAREQGLRKDEGTLLNNIGLVYDNLGQPQQALDFFNQALPISREVGDRSGEATTLNNIGAVYSALGQPHQALDFYNQALPILIDVGNRGRESVTRYNMAFIFRAEGQLEEAIAQLRLVVALDEQTSHPDLESDRAFLAQFEAELAEQK